MDALPAKVTGTCVPLVCENGHYMLLWGADADNRDSDYDDEHDATSEKPKASVKRDREKI